MNSLLNSQWKMSTKYEKKTKIHMQSILRKRRLKSVHFVACTRNIAIEGQSMTIHFSKSACGKKAGTWCQKLPKSNVCDIYMNAITRCVFCSHAYISYCSCRVNDWISNMMHSHCALLKCELIAERWHWSRPCYNVRYILLLFFLSHFEMHKLSDFYFFFFASYNYHH